mmetsp:Transcript_24602/g.81827  ORF Transcript_24602/g.81827 Transcript_24602/m.81827 type:complete len:202 (+) Transcript_24602:325-930(+)
MRGREAEQPARLVRRDVEGCVAERKLVLEPVGLVEARGVVVCDLTFLARRARAEPDEVVVRHEGGRRAVERLADGRLVPDGGSDHGGVVGGVRHGHKLVAAIRHRHRPSAGDPVKEEGQVALALRGAVDILRPEVGEGEAHLCDLLLGLPLARALDRALLAHRPIVALVGRVHARRRHVGVVAHTPGLGRCCVRGDRLGRL